MKTKYGQLIRSEFKSTYAVETVVLAGIVLLLMGLVIGGVYFFNVDNSIILNEGGEISSFSKRVLNTVKLADTPTMIFAAVLAACQNHGSDGGRINEFLETLPYTRKQRFMVKYLYGVGTYTVLLAFAYIGTVVIMFVQNGSMDSVYRLSPFYGALKANDNILILLLMFLVLWISMTAVYTVCMLMNKFINNNAAASVIGLLMFVLPYFAVDRINMIMQHMGKNSAAVSDDYMILNRNASYVAGVYDKGSHNTGAGIVAFESGALICGLILAGIIIAGFILNLIMADRYELADAGYVISKKYIKYTIIILTGITGALAIVSGMRNMRIGGVIATGVISGIFISFIAGKIIRIGDRH